MNTKMKVVLAFVTGGVLFQAPWAISNAPSTEEVLSRAMAGAMQQVEDYRQKREAEELNKLPNIMDCQNMEWMNCLLYTSPSPRD